MITMDKRHTTIREASMDTLYRYYVNNPDMYMRLHIPMSRSDYDTLAIIDKALQNGKDSLTEKELDTVIYGEYAVDNMKEEQDD